MAFHRSTGSTPFANFYGFFQGATLVEIVDYFQKPPVSWQPVDLQLPAEVINAIRASQPNLRSNP